jgi:hypothetical protein
LSQEKGIITLLVPDSQETLHDFFEQMKMVFIIVLSLLTSCDEHLIRICASFSFMSKILMIETTKEAQPAMIRFMIRT